MNLNRGKNLAKCFAPLNNRTQFQNYFCNYVYGKEELFKTGEIKDSQRGIRKRLETYSGKVQFVSYLPIIIGNGSILYQVREVWIMVTQKRLQAVLKNLKKS